MLKHNNRNAGFAILLTDPSEILTPNFRCNIHIPFINLNTSMIRLAQLRVSKSSYSFNCLYIKPVYLAAEIFRLFSFTS